MHQTLTKQEKLKQFLHILIPILVTQLGLFSMNFFDTMMTGHASPKDLAGVAIGSSLWIPVFTGLSGILLAVTPIVAQAVGAKKEREASFSIIQGIYLSIVMAIVILLLGAFLLDPILNKMSLEDHVRVIAHDYLVALSYGIIPVFVYNVIRSFIDALGQTRVTMIITLMSLPINVIFNYILIYGKLGFPALGGVGAGYASAITYWMITFIGLYIISTRKPFNRFEVLSKFSKVSFVKWKEILIIGLPIGFSIFFETSIFSAVTLLMSTFSTITIAGHQIALNFASFLYMIPLSISMALTIVVGFEVGAKRFQDAKEYSWLGVAIAILLAFVSAIVLLVFRTPIAKIYSTDPSVLAMATHFLLYASFFQLSDALQAPIQGALRGYKDVNVAFFMSLVSYWVVGLPVGYILANYTNIGAPGYWVGLITGLTVGAVGLILRLVFVQKQKKTGALV